MNIHTHPGICIQNSFSQLCIQFHRCTRIRFLCSADMNFKRLLFILIHLIHIFQHIPCKSFKTFIFFYHYRTDESNTKDTFQCLQCFVIIELTFCLYIDSSLLFGNMKSTLYSPQHIFHLTDQSILKHISVFSFYSNFCIFN